MDSFRTHIPLPKYPFSLSHTDRILSLGSCFSDHIGSRLINSKFDCLLNPFGILYNPVSIARNLLMSVDDYEFGEQDVFNFRGRWHSYHHPGKFSREDETETLKALQNTAGAVRAYLESTNRIICTLGSSMVYEHEGFGDIVANCHKLPASNFNRRRLKTDEIIENLKPAFEKIKSKNEDLQVVLTVSPVRHGKEGMHTNQKSKAVLLLAVEALCEELPYVHYFPSYEIMLDDLRDYRFYKPDMMHPSETAIDYIWTYVEESLFAEATKKLNKQIHKLRAAVHHRPLHPGTDEHISFIKKSLEKIDALSKSYPRLSFDKERAAFLRQLQEVNNL
ncbi:MAG: GSCFA domain-containing protein [Bacteroidetes bacterium]|nr:GSCFA domain-containing protein [Bacteroidota bacterium]